jgi:hypothetical protein
MAKSGGKPTFLTREIPELARLIQRESPSSSNSKINYDHLQVGKVGLPPLFLLQRSGNPNPLSQRQCLRPSLQINLGLAEHDARPSMTLHNFP